MMLVGRKRVMAGLMVCLGQVASADDVCAFDTLSTIQGNINVDHGFQIRQGSSGPLLKQRYADASWHDWGVESQKWNHSAQFKTIKTQSAPKRRFTNMKLLHMHSELDASIGSLGVMTDATGSCPISACRSACSTTFRAGTPQMSMSGDIEHSHSPDCTI